MTDIRSHAAGLADHNEVLRRQVHPSHEDDVEVIHFTAFQPTGKEDYLLSTLRGYLDPKECYDRHRSKGLKTIGTYGVRVGHAANVGLTCLADAGLDGSPEDHASVDFKPLSRKERQRAARSLRDKALELGRLYPLENPDLVLPSFSESSAEASIRHSGSG